MLISGLEGELSALNGTLGVVDGPARASASNDGLASTMASVGQPGNREGGGVEAFLPPYPLLHLHPHPVADGQFLFPAWIDLTC